MISFRQNKACTTQWTYTQKKVSHNNRLIWMCDMLIPMNIQWAPEISIHFWMCNYAWRKLSIHIHSIRGSNCSNSKPGTPKKINTSSKVHQFRWDYLIPRPKKMPSHKHLCIYILMDCRSELWTYQKLCHLNEILIYHKIPLHHPCNCPSLEHYGAHTPNFRFRYTFNATIQNNNATASS